jgi:hypothetical protein
MIEMRWMCWENAGVKRLEYRQTIPTATGPIWTDWEVVPDVDATHPAVTPAKE